MTTTTTIQRLGWLLSEMNDPEQRVLLFIAERIHKGRQAYGPLDPHDGRNWRREMIEEMADMLVYDSVGKDAVG